MAKSKDLRKKTDLLVYQFNDSIKKIQSLVDIGMLRFDPASARVFMHPYCLLEAPDDSFRKNYINNVAMYYIVKYWEVFKADLNATIAPLTPNYEFTCVEQGTNKEIAKYVDDKNIILVI